MKCVSVLLIVALFAYALGASAAEPEGTQGDFRAKGTVFGVKGGMILPGTIYVDDFSKGGDISFSFGGFVDYSLGEKLYGGISVDVHNMSVYDQSKLLYDISATLKAKIFSPSKPFTFRPGIGIGYGGLPGFKADGEDVDASSYFLVKGMVEFVVHTSNRLSWLVEAAIIGAPSGGNKDYSVTFGPGALFRGGLVF